MEIISHSTANQKLSLSGPRRARVLFWSWQRWKANKSLSIRVVKKWSQTTIICFWKHPFSSQRKRNKVFSTTLAFSVHTNLFSDENKYIILIAPGWHMRLRSEISIVPCPLLPSQVLSISTAVFISASIVLLQISRGRPLFLLPLSGAHLNYAVQLTKTALENLCLNFEFS